MGLARSVLTRAAWTPRFGKQLVHVFQLFAFCLRKQKAKKDKTQGSDTHK